MMASLSNCTLVDGVFTRSYVIPNAVTFIFNRRPCGKQYIACVQAVRSNNMPLIISVEEFTRIIEAAVAWLKGKCATDDVSYRSETVSYTHLTLPTSDLV